MTPGSNTLRSDIQRATALAAAGGLVAGFDCLVQGLRRAEDALRNQQPGAPALIQCYHRALGDYIDRYSVRLDPD